METCRHLLVENQMRGTSAGFLVILILCNSIATYMSINCDTKFDTYNCSTTSQVGDLIGFINVNQDGLNYVFLNFNMDKVVAVATFYYDIQQAIRYHMRIIQVIGYIIETICQETGESHLFYINLTKDGPAISSIRQSGTYPNITRGKGGEDPTIYGTAIDDPLAELAFRRITSNDYNAKCNTFTQVNIKPCQCQSTYFLKQPALTLSLKSCQSVSTVYIDNTSGSATGAGDYIDTFGLSCVKCKKEAQPLKGSNPPLFVEDCSTTNNTYPYCEYYGPSLTFKVEKNCNTLNGSEVCKLAQSYNKAYSSKKNSPSLFSLVIFPMLGGLVNADNNPPKTDLRSVILFLFLRGYTYPSNVENQIMGGFSDIANQCYKCLNPGSTVNNNPISTFLSKI